jgi:hypothetical protein
MNILSSFYHIERIKLWFKSNSLEIYHSKRSSKICWKFTIKISLIFKIFYIFPAGIQRHIFVFSQMNKLILIPFLLPKFILFSWNWSMSKVKGMEAKLSKAFHYFFIFIHHFLQQEKTKQFIICVCYYDEK